MVRLPSIPLILLVFYLAGIVYLNLHGRALLEAYSNSPQLVPWMGVITILLLALFTAKRLRESIVLVKFRSAILQLSPALFGIVCVLIFSEYLIEQPPERLHYIKYATLALLIYFANLKIPRVSASLSVTLLTMTVGTLDEFFQKLAPGRIFDIKDILLNSLGALLGGLLVHGVELLLCDRQTSSASSSSG